MLLKSQLSWNNNNNDRTTKKYKAIVKLLILKIAAA